MSEKILYGELKAGQIVLVDTDGAGKDEAFTFVGTAHSPLDAPLSAIQDTVKTPDAPEAT